MAEKMDDLKVHPQSRRLVKYKEVSVWVPPNAPERLASEDIAPKPGFEGPYEYEVPSTRAFSSPTRSRHRRSASCCRTRWSMRSTSWSW